MAAAPGPAACLIVVSLAHCVVGPDSYRFTISVLKCLYLFWLKCSFLFCSLKFTPEHMVYGKVTSQGCNVNVVHHSAKTSPHRERLHCPAWRLIKVVFLIHTSILQSKYDPLESHEISTAVCECTTVSLIICQSLIGISSFFYRKPVSEMAHQQQRSSLLHSFLLFAVLQSVQQQKLQLLCCLH